MVAAVANSAAVADSADVVVATPAVVTSKKNEKRMRRHQSVAAIQEEHLKEMKKQSQLLYKQRNQEIDSKVETETERCVWCVVLSVCC